MHICMLSPISWRTPPRHYGPWENIVSLLTEQLVAQGVRVTLFATGDSETRGELAWVCPRPYSEDRSLDAKAWECLHISEAFARADEFDLIHNHFDFLPLSFTPFVETPVVTTIHGLSSEAILPVFERYNSSNHYVAISAADRRPQLDYAATIHHGIDLTEFPYSAQAEDYLLFFGRIHPDKGVAEAIEVARRAGKRLLIAGIIQDEGYYREHVQPHVDGDGVAYLGSVGPQRRRELLGGALAMLHLANFDEPFGLAPVESMACGTPVIATPRGAMRETVVDGETGFIVENLDSAVMAAERAGELDRRGCRCHVEDNFTVERMAAQYLSVYDRVLAARENHRPWGHYRDLVEGARHKVKELHVEPGKRMSLQRHLYRAEHWTVVAGEALVNVGERDIRLSRGESVDVPCECAHRIANPGDSELVMIETQLGEQLREDDIVRLEDDYGRVGEPTTDSPRPSAR